MSVEVDRGNKDDRSPLKARMLADQVGQLKAIEVRHAHVHQDDRDVGFEEMLQRLFSRRGLDQIFPEFSEDDS